MSKPLTADQLIESIKRRASIPTSQDTFTDEDLLEFANEELQLGVVPGIMSVHEDHLLFEEEVAIEANRSDYEIPHRALGNKLRDVQFKVGENNLTELTRIGIGERFSEYSSETNIRKFYVKGNKVVLNSSVGAQPSGSLVFVYYIRPSSLVKLEEVGVISNINEDTGVVTLSNIPNSFNVVNTYDLYKADSPSSILDIDLSISSINPIQNTITFGTTQKQTLKVSSKSEQEVTDITFDTQASTTDGGYFLLNSASNVRGYFIWMDKTGSSTAPSGSDTVGRIAVRVDISGDTTSNDVAVSVATALNSKSDFTSPIPVGNTLTVTNSIVGDTDNAINGNNPVGGVFSITVITNGGSIEDLDTITFNDSITGISSSFWFNATGTATAPIDNSNINLVEVDISGSFSSSDVATLLSSAMDFNLTNMNISSIQDIISIDRANTVGQTFNIGASISNFTTTTIEPGSSIIPKELKIGDHISLACEAAIAQIPTELHPLLAEMVACRVLEALGDTQALQNALIKVKQMQTAAGMLIDSRIDDAPQKVVNRHD
jgi:hypothetical protein